MTYSSRNFLISCGVGSDDRVPRFSNRLSSAMMSLQTSTHSSQMNTVGPAISLRTSFWSLLQNEQRSEEHTSELQSLTNLVCRLLLEKKNKKQYTMKRSYMRRSMDH